MEIRKERSVFIGTSGYSYDDWKGVFYPEQIRSDRFLEFYAGRFPFVELNFSYYRQPAPEMLEKMVKNTPESFRFAIKAHRSLTHDREPYWRKAAALYRDGISPLMHFSRLAGILFQFPFSFHRTDSNRRYLGALTDYFSDLPAFIEFRNNEWMRNDVLTELEERRIGLVNTDNPDLESLPGPTALATGSAGYIRFHGRNKANWWKGDNVSRYDYFYSTEELSEWIPRIQKMLEKVTILYLAFNNHHKGQAVANALQILTLLQDQGIR